MNKFVQKINGFSSLLGTITAWFTFVMVILMAAIVILRYAFDFGAIAMQESVLYLHGAALLLGCGYTLKHDGHVRVDVFYRTFSPYRQCLINFLGHVFLLLPVVIFIFVMSFEYVINAWSMLEASPEPGGLAFVYVQKSLLLLFSVCLFMQAVAMGIHDIEKLKNYAQEER